MSEILVTGGAGYIGTNVVNALVLRGEKVVVVDDFSNCKQKYIDKLKNLYKGQVECFSFSFGDREKLESLFKTHNFSAVIHLAGKKYVQESNEKQELYKLVNVDMTQTLLDVMKEFSVKKIVFSSTAMVYGNVMPCPISELRELSPVSYYATTKLMAEKLIADFVKTSKGQGVILRLSNPIGADDKLMLGDDNLAKAKPILPYLLDAAKNGNKVVLNGNDYNTKDGTPVRDYVHVCDVAEAFCLAVEKDVEDLEIYNIGSGNEGQSVLQILQEVEKVVGKSVDHSFGERREGDVEIFVSDNSKAKNDLGLKISRDLNDMVLSQYKFLEETQKKSTK